MLEAEGDALELAARLQRECAGEIGRVVAVCAQVRASAPQLREAAVRVGAEQIGGSDSFCFRIRKRGAHQLDEDTAVLEREIGSAIWVGLERKHGRKPRVDLENPDVTIRAEVLGPIALVGVQRKSWSRSEPETREEYR